MSLIKRLVFESQDLRKIFKFISANFGHGLHVGLVFHLIECRSHVLSSAFELQHFDISHCLFEILIF